MILNFEALNARELLIKVWWYTLPLWINTLLEKSLC